MAFKVPLQLAKSANSKDDIDGSSCVPHLFPFTISSDKTHVLRIEPKGLSCEDPLDADMSEDMVSIPSLLFNTSSR